MAGEVVEIRIFTSVAMGAREQRKCRRANGTSPNDFHLFAGMKTFPESRRRGHPRSSERDRG